MAADERWERLEALFAAARDVPPADRAAFLARATADAGLRSEVLSLLAAAEGSGPVDRIIAAESLDPLPRLRAALADRYAIERELGRGGMAIVYLAQDLKHRRPVALKLLRPELGVHLGPRRFLREIETAARLSHPHILPLHDSGASDGLFWFVMPFVDGESLRARLDRESHVPLDEAIAIAHEVAGALHHAHSQGIVHRDIKPENILMSGGHALVSDFGIARAVDASGSDRLTETGMAVGTPSYMSPEQASAGRAIDARSDIYSLACVVYEMLGGQPPFTGPTPQAVLARHTLDPVPSLRTLRPSVPGALEDVIERALAKVPADRFATALEFASALERARHAPPGAAAPPRRAARTWTWAAAIALLGAAGLWLVKNGFFGRAERLVGLVVLPVSDAAGDSTQRYFAAGVHDALIGQLATISGLRVISRTSALHYAGGGKSIPEIARELHVGWVVAPDARRDGDSVRLRLQLIQAEPEERQRWSGAFAQPAARVLSVYSEAARAIAHELGVTLTPAESEQLAVVPPVNPRTYEDYLRGMYFLELQTPEALARGIGFLRDGVANDPADARAYAGLALGYGLVGHTPESPADAFARARAAAGRALLLDSTLALGHAALGMIKMYAKSEWDWDGAGHAFQRALELNPSLSDIRVHYGWYLMLAGREADAVAQMRRARDIDPLSPLHAAWLGRLYWAYGRYDEALAEARASLDLSPNYPLGLYVQGLVYASQGRYAEAIAVQERGAAASPSQRWALADAYAAGGREAEARRILTTLEHEAHGPNSWGIAQVYATLGDKDAAFRWLDTAVAFGHTFIPWIEWNPHFAPLRDDPRFQNLKQRLHLPT